MFSGESGCMCSTSAKVDECTATAEFPRYTAAAILVMIVLTKSTGWSPMKFTVRTIGLMLLVAACAQWTPVSGQEASANGGSGYSKPPQNVLDVLHAPSPPQPIFSPTRDRILLVSWV